MEFSILTPLHSLYNRYIGDAYDSLVNQTHREWEWIIIVNNGGEVPDRIRQNPAVVVVTEPEEGNGIGRLKRLAASRATKQVLVELDADDTLTPVALERLAEAFQDPAVAMAYSNSAQFRDGTLESPTYSEYWGWRTRPFFHNGKELNEQIAWPPSSQMMRFIFWAPNHVRAWRRSAYDLIGGHDPDIKVGDDHDLCCRTYIKYGARGLRHIDECLYLYRLHGQNSCNVYNQDVQDQTLKNYLQYSREIANKDARDQGLRMIDLGGRINSWPGFETVDLHGALITADLNDRWPFDDSTVGVLRASHIVEHLKDPIHTMNEAYRVLAPGGWFFIDVPSTDGRGAFQDPSHVSFWNENSIWYYTNRDYARFIPSYQGRFQNARTVTWYPGQFEKDHNIPMVQADLIALKPPYADRPVGEVLI